jgi:DNA repair protein RecN (Recombination protein N)
MLERLTIRDLVLVEHAEVEFGPELNVVTGETGAGKSLLVRAVDLLVGGAADAEAVREGAGAAVVEGEFRPGAEALRRVRALLTEWGIECDGEVVIVRRELRAGGRSRAVVNQSAVTRGALQQLGEALADLHGQHEHQSLLRAGAGVDVLDRLGGHAATVERYVDALHGWRAAAQELKTLEVSLASHSDHRQWLEQAAADLDAAALEEGEEERLKVDAARLAHADRLRTHVTQALERLTEGESAAVDAITAAARAVEQAAAVDPTLADTLPTLDEARIATAEAARALSDYAARLEADPVALEAVEARRETIARLTRKYRRPAAALLEWRAELGVELATGADAEGARARGRERAEAAEALCLASGRALTGQRLAAAKTWNARLSRELEPLGFPQARIEFTVTPRAAGTPPGGRGLDEVEILFGANPGEPSRPLQKIASGGELSRVMLALKTALEAQDPVDLLLFDEVDSGIGGAVARAVGERLRRLSRHRQLVCVTHLPMIAALASHHLRVTKHVIGGRTTARIETVTGRERVEELARMLAGDRVTDTTRRQARELLGEPIPRAVTG